MIFGLATIVPAYKDETVTLRTGQQKRAGRGEIRIKFVSVVEDSRCPEKSACVWAGNAKIRAVVSDRHGTKTVTMNTNTGNHGDQYGGWAINLVELSPKLDGRIKQSSYRATFSISRLQR
jgi:hypothetical protein